MFRVLPGVETPDYCLSLRDVNRWFYVAPFFRFLLETEVRSTDIYLQNTILFMNRDKLHCLQLRLGIVMRPITAAFTLMALIAATGCVPLDYGIFISTLDEDITLEVRNQQSDGWGEVRSFKIPKRGEKKIDYAVPEVAVLDTSGRVLFRQVIPVLRPEIATFQKPGERKTFFLLTRDGAYPIPVAWRENWKEHVSEIVTGYDLRTARQRSVRGGVTK